MSSIRCNRWLLPVCCLILVLAASAVPRAETRQDKLPAKEGERCGTIVGISCEDGLWCDYREGSCKGNDLEGVCVKIPDVCTRDYNPVCGCDGKTYPNDCMRIKAKVQKDTHGECKKEKDPTQPAKKR